MPLRVDTCDRTPSSRLKLLRENFPHIGRMLTSAGLPTVFVMEGGYAVDELGVKVPDRFIS